MALFKEISEKIKKSTHTGVDNFLILRFFLALEQT